MVSLEERGPAVERRTHYSVVKLLGPESGPLFRGLGDVARALWVLRCTVPYSGGISPLVPPCFGSPAMGLAAAVTGLRCFMVESI